MEICMSLLRKCVYACVVIYVNGEMEKRIVTKGDRLSHNNK